MSLQYRSVNKSESDALLYNEEPIYTMQAITRTRPVTPEDAEHGKGENLARCLTWVDLIMYGLGSTVGAGIFVITGQVAQEVAGPSVVLSFLLAGFASLISAFCYSEFSARIPLAGSAYTFAYATLGELVGWFIGWDLTLEYAISASAIAQAWNNTFVQLLDLVGLDFPARVEPWVAGHNFNSWVGLFPLSALIIVAMTLILMMGVKDSARFNTVMTIINISIICFLIVTGAFYIKHGNWYPFVPFGVTGVIKGAGKVFFSFIGFDSVTTLAGEVRKPKKDLPIGIVGTLLIATTLYVFASGVLTGMVDYKFINPNTPFSSAFELIGLKWASSIIIVGSLTTMTAATLCSLLGQPRIYFQMAKDGLLWPAFARVNSRQAPVTGTIVTGIFAVIFALFCNLDTLGNMISIGTLLAFTLVCGGVVVLRFGDAPNPPPRGRLVMFLLFTFLACVGFSLTVRFMLHWYWMAAAFAVFVACVIVLITLRPKNIPVNKEAFYCPLVPGLPALGMLVNVIMIVQMDWLSIVRVGVWAAAGMTLYFVYGIKHSALRVRTRIL